MGNIVPLDAAKKQQIEDIAQEFLATFGREFVVAYGAEFAKMKLKQIDEETYGDENKKKELMYRKKVELSDPHKMGYLTKKGAIVKNWKKRYFVVNPDYTVNYYETEEAYEKGSKPKGVIYLAGYQIEENADSAEVERLKALGKSLGIKAEDLPLPDKYPEHTLELMHERRRAYYITAADEESKKDWVEMFKTCCKKASGLKNKDPLAQAAFKTAYYRACRESCWYKRYGECGGTEEQVLSETIVEIINYRVLSSTYSSLSGNFTIRKKIREQVMKALDSLVLAMVIPSYKGVVESTQSLKGPLERSIDEKKDEIVGVQKKITDQLSDKLETILNKAVKEATEDIKKMFGDLKDLAGKASVEMRKECVVGLIERLIKETKESKDIDDTIKKHYRVFDRVISSLTSWNYWYKVYNIEQNNIDIIRKYKDTFDQTGGYTSVYLSHDLLCEVADAAFFTFEEIFKDRSKETDLKDNIKTAELMESVKNDILPKYDHDSTLTPENIAFQITTMVVVEYVTTKIDPLTKDIRKHAGNLIPEPISKIVSIEDRYELYVGECCKDLIKKAMGKPQQSTKEKTQMEPMNEPKKLNENGEMKVKGKEEINGEKEEDMNEPKKPNENGEMKEVTKMESEEKEKSEVNENKEKPEQNGEMEVKAKEEINGEKEEHMKESEKIDANGEMDEVDINSEENNENNNRQQPEMDDEVGEETRETSENSECQVANNTAM